jgi:hypothetical protein
MAQPTRERTADYYPEPAAPNVVRIIPLGGVEEVGRNMTAVEVGATGDILVFDAGFQFVSEDASPGVDYILPNTKYLEKNITTIGERLQKRPHRRPLPSLMSEWCPKRVCEQVCLRTVSRILVGSRCFPCRR